MAACLADVKQGKKICRLAGRSEHTGSTALQRCDLRRHIVIGGILQPGIEITGRLQIKQLAHVLTGVVLEGG